MFLDFDKCQHQNLKKKTQKKQKKPEEDSATQKATEAGKMSFNMESGPTTSNNHRQTNFVWEMYYNSLNENAEQNQNDIYKKNSQ